MNFFCTSQGFYTGRSILMLRKDESWALCSMYVYYIARCLVCRQLVSYKNGVVTGADETISPGGGRDFKAREARRKFFSAPPWAPP